MNNSTKNLLDRIHSFFLWVAGLQPSPWQIKKLKEYQDQQHEILSRYYRVDVIKDHWNILLPKNPGHELSPADKKSCDRELLELGIHTWGKDYPRNNS